MIKLLNRFYLFLFICYLSLGDSCVYEQKIFNSVYYCLCKQIIFNSKDYLLLNNPDLIIKYYLIEPTSIDSQIYRETINYNSGIELLNHIRAELNFNEYGDVEKIIKIIDRLELNHSKIYRDSMLILNDIKENDITNDDDVFMYILKHNKETIRGLMLVRKGKLIGDVPKYEYFGAVVHESK